MAREDQAGQVAAAAKPDADQVVDFLVDNPDFFLKRPDLAERLAAHAAAGAMPEGVVDLQGYMVGRLRGEVDRLKHGQQAIIGASRANEHTLQRVHTAVLFLLDARSFEDLIQTVTADLAVLLDIDVVALLVEASDSGPMPIAPAGIRVVDDGFIDHAMGDKEIVLSTAHPADEAIFGGGATLVQSQALVRLSISPESPPCMLALGSRDAEVYTAGMRTDLIAFMARVLERAVRNWLDVKV